MARWQSANVLQTTPGGRQLWRFNANGNAFVFAEEQKLAINEQIPADLVVKYSEGEFKLFAEYRFCFLCCLTGTHVKSREEELRRHVRGYPHHFLLGSRGSTIAGHLFQKLQGFNCLRTVRILRYLIQEFGKPF